MFVGEKDSAGSDGPHHDEKEKTEQIEGGSIDYRTSVGQRNRMVGSRGRRKGSSDLCRVQNVQALERHVNYFNTVKTAWTSPRNDSFNYSVLLPVLLSKLKNKNDVDKEKVNIPKKFLFSKELWQKFVHAIECDFVTPYF